MGSCLSQEPEVDFDGPGESATLGLYSYSPSILSPPLFLQWISITSISCGPLERELLARFVPATSPRQISPSIKAIPVLIGLYREKKGHEADVCHEVHE